LAHFTAIHRNFHKDKNNTWNYPLLLIDSWQIEEHQSVRALLNLKNQEQKSEEAHLLLLQTPLSQALTNYMMMPPKLQVRLAKFTGNGRTRRKLLPGQ
jgi:hypothetical protein